MSANYKRIGINIDGPVSGPFEVTKTSTIAVSGKIVSETETIKVRNYNLSWKDEDVLS